MYQSKQAAAQNLKSQQDLKYGHFQNNLNCPSQTTAPPQAVLAVTQMESMKTILSETSPYEYVTLDQKSSHK